MHNIYTNKYNKYNLSNNEINNIDKAWELISDFSQTNLSRSGYRNYIINFISKKYTVELLYTLEIIIEKMYWNLRNKISLFFNNPKLTLSHKNITNIEKKILLQNKRITQSNIRKSFVYDNNNKQYIIDYYYPNDIDLIASAIIINRSIYDTFMLINSDFETLQISPYSNIIEFDYPYPNLNTISPFMYNNEIRKQNIISMYFEPNCEKNWF
jgi:hypothetical protein